MERDNNIPIRNIYYMLSYAYQTLNLSEYKQIGTEKFENVKELYAEILAIGIPVLIRGGLIKDYISVEETSNVIKGKIDINSTINKNALVIKKASVVYEEFSENILLNQIIKATLVYLSRSNKISQKTRRVRLYPMRLLMITAITDSISFFRSSMLRLASLPGRCVRKAADSNGREARCKCSISLIEVVELIRYIIQESTGRQPYTFLIDGDIRLSDCVSAEVYRSTLQLPIILATSGSRYDKKRLSRVSRVEICSMSSALNSKSKISKFSTIRSLRTDFGMTTTSR